MKVKISLYFLTDQQKFTQEHKQHRKFFKANFSIEICVIYYIKLALSRKKKYSVWEKVCPIGVVKWLVIYGISYSSIHRDGIYLWRKLYRIFLYFFFFTRSIFYFWNYTREVEHMESSRNREKGGEMEWIISNVVGFKSRIQASTQLSRFWPRFSLYTNLLVKDKNKAEKKKHEAWSVPFLSFFLFISSFPYV